MLLAIDIGILIFALGLAFACGRILQKVDHIEQIIEGQSTTNKKLDDTLNRLESGFGRMEESVKHHDMRLSNHDTRIKKIEDKLSL